MSTTHAVAEALKQGAAQMGLALSTTHVERFMSYLALLAQEAQRVNITGIRDEKEIIIKHFLDSLSCKMVVNLTPGMKVLDVGSGAGLPGVPLKIYAPEIQLTVMDASQKHLNFLYKLRGKMREISSIDCNFEILEGRAEECGQSKEHREAYDLVVSRAVAKMSTLTEYCLPLVKINGYFLAMKGQTGASEARDAESVIQMLGGEIDAFKDIILPDNSKRMLIKVLKIRQTPIEYPRRTGVPEKKPLG